MEVGQRGREGTAETKSDMQSSDEAKQERRGGIKRKEAKPGVSGDSRSKPLLPRRNEFGWISLLSTSRKYPTPPFASPTDVFRDAA